MFIKYGTGDNSNIFLALECMINIHLFSCIREIWRIVFARRF